MVEELNLAIHVRLSFSRSNAHHARLTLQLNKGFRKIYFQI